MPNRQVDVDGTTASKVIDVDYSKPVGDKIGTATISVGNTQTNRNLFTSGAEVTIKVEDPDNPGTYTDEWVGEVIGKPSNASKRNLTLEVDAESKAAQAEFGKVNRPFIEKTNSEIVTQMVSKVADPERKETFITKAEATADWSHNVRDFELMDSISDVVRTGGNALYFGIRPGASGTIYAEYTGGPTISGRSLDRLDTGLLIADKGGNFVGKCILVDGDGIQYEWELELTGRAENKQYKLPVEDAEIKTTADYANGTIRWELITEGNVPDERAFMIDSAKAVTVSLRTRSIDLTTDVEATSFTSTRRLNGSMLEMATRLAEEEGYDVFVDSTGTLNFKQSGGTKSSLSIDETDSTLNCVNVAVDRDFSKIRNQVTIQGKDDLRVAYESTQSISFYNEKAPKEEPIDDEAIRTEEQARRRARGFLEENAFDDGAISFTIGNPDFRDITPGEAISVTWPSEDLDGEYVVNSVDATAEGFTVINLSGNVTL